MNPFEQQLEDLLVRVFTRVFNSLNPGSVEVQPQEQPAAPARRTRKPKETTEAPAAPAAETKVEEAPAPAPVVAAEPPVPAADPLFGFDVEVPAEVLKFERKNVSAVLVTIAKNEKLGPAKAYELLGSFGGAKEVKDLKEADYQTLITKGATLLGISVADALKLDPTKK